MTSASDRDEPIKSASLPFEEGQLVALFAGVAEPIFIEDIQLHRLVYWSASAGLLFGYSAADVLGQSGSRLLEDTSQNNRGETRDAVLSEVETKGSWRGRRRFRRADGAVFEAETHVSRLISHRDKFAVTAISRLIAAHASDHAAPARTEEIAAGLPEASAPRPAGPSNFPSSEQALGRLLRHIATYAVFSTDATGRIGEWNEEARRLFGYDHGEIAGKPLARICVEDSARVLQKILAQATEQGSARYYQWMKRKDGQRLYARVVVFALRENDRVQGFLFVLRDDSREPGLRQISREKDQMAAIGTAASILAHEIGNPLNGISATVQLLEHCLGRPTPPVAEIMLSSVQDLKSEVKRLTALLTEFKNIAWPQKLARGPVNLERLIRQSAGEIEARSLGQGVELSLECQADLPFLNGDDDKLRQALHNVLDNALDAMPGGGRLAIEVYEHEQTICIDIVDTGVGIPKNLRVFDLFSSTKPEGIGLGLFLVQQIVLAHDGAVTYSSTPGQGTTFRVTFPLNPSPEPFGADFLDLI